MRQPRHPGRGWATVSRSAFARATRPNGSANPTHLAMLGGGPTRLPKRRGFSTTAMTRFLPPFRTASMPGARCLAWFAPRWTTIKRHRSRTSRCTRSKRRRAWCPRTCSCWRRGGARAMRTLLTGSWLRRRLPFRRIGCLPKKWAVLLPASTGRSRITASCSSGQWTGSSAT